MSSTRDRQFSTFKTLPWEGILKSKGALFPSIYIQWPLKIKAHYAFPTANTAPWKDTQPLPPKRRRGVLQCLLHCETAAVTEG